MNKTIYKAGFWSALVAFVAASGFSVAQILQIIGLVSYPWDEILIYGFSLFIATPFMLALLVLHEHAQSIESHIGNRPENIFS